MYRISEIMYTDGSVGERRRHMVRDEPQPFPQTTHIGRGYARAG
jgi:hypothetical protein